jgi:hypothetical protein
VISLSSSAGSYVLSSGKVCKHAGHDQPGTILAVKEAPSLHCREDAKGFGIAHHITEKLLDGEAPTMDSIKGNGA